MKVYMRVGPGQLIGMPDDFIPPDFVRCGRPKTNKQDEEMNKQVFDVIPKQDIKELCTDFFYWWYNQPGTNTEEGFEEWYKLKTEK